MFRFLIGLSFNLKIFNKKNELTNLNTDEEKNNFQSKIFSLLICASCQSAHKNVQINKVN